MKNYKSTIFRVVKTTTLLIAFFIQFVKPVPAQNIENKDLKSKAITLGFIENKGQIIDQNNILNPSVKYLLNMPGLNVQLTSNGFSYDAYVTERHKKEELQNQIPGFPEPLDDLTLYFHRIDIEFIGANNSPKIVAENAGSDYLNYYTTSTPEEGITYVRHFGKVTYKDLYPGIDLIFMAQPGKNKPVEYNFIIHPGADLSLLKWKYKGSNNTKLQEGNICIQTVHGLIKESIPQAWEQETAETIGISYTDLEDDVYTFAGSYNTKNTLVIDPVPDLEWASYYGGSGNDEAYGVSYDSAGNVYLTGQTTSTSNIATSGTQQSTYAGGTVQYALGGDAFLIKFSSTGTRIWGTYFGGSGEDVGYSLRTNKGGDSYVSGDTKSTSGIATTGAFQTSFAGSYHDVFLAKFNTSGIRQWGTYYGGTGNDRSYYNSMAMDASGNVYLTGVNNTPNNSWITTSGCYQSTNLSTSAYDEPFASKWSPSGTLIWGTYYGGSSHDQAYAIAIDDSNNVYLTGSCTSTTGFSTSSSYQSSKSGGNDAFIVKLNSTGTARIWGTYYGNSGNEYARGITVDHSGNVYIAGYTSSTSGFTTSGAFQSTHAGGSYDGFLAKFSSSGSRVWGTYYGGAGSDVFSKLTLTSNGDLILTGYIDTTSSVAGLPTTGAFQTTYGGGTQDGIIAKFNTSGTRLWCSYFGGELQDLIFNNVVDANGNIFIAGRTLSTSGIATSGTHQTSYAGGTMDGFVAKVLDQPVLISSATTIQPDTTSTPAGTTNKMIIGVKITTTGYNPFAKVTEFTFDTAGVFSYSNITGTAKVYYTGNTDTFNTINLFDSTSSKPTSAFTVSGNQVLDTGTVYFWLTFDVDFYATVNNFLDAKCTEIKWDSGGTSVTISPVITSPVGKIRITPPLKKLGSISFSQPSTYYVFRYSTNNPVLRVDLNVIGTAGTLNLEQLTVGAVNTNNSDVSDVKLYFTASPAFSTTNMVGTATSLSGGSATFTSLSYSLPSGASYVWVTYDIPGSATIFDTVDAKIPAHGVVIGGKSSPSSDQNPAGDRIIYSNFQYDAGVSSILSPASPFCKTTQDIKVRLYNYGLTALTSDTIRWTVNGVAQTPYVWTGSLLTGTSTDLTISTYSFTMGTPYTIKVFPSYINGIFADGYHPNDT
ncbi:SBBP repeat-containing protein, partial [Bacteroidota bacterium]